MTREDIISMAREASIEVDWSFDFHMRLEHFAALVAAAERERIIAANRPEIEKINAHIKALEKAVEDEREACAKVADLVAREIDDTNGTATYIAAAIRARGQE